MKPKPFATSTGARMATNGRVALRRTTLLREVYRSLINTGRTYAAFRDADRENVARLINRSPVLDPMSGYGGLAAICADLGIASVGIEYNPPQFFWQLLTHPGRVAHHQRAIGAILGQRRRWPRPRQRAVVSNDFFPDESRAVLDRLLGLLISICADKTPPSGLKPWEMAVSLLLPFSGRLACTSPGDVSTHTKHGGTCVLIGWQDDFCIYLKALNQHLDVIKSRSKCTDHHVTLGDARTASFGQQRFGSMFTSPPYPNHRDFTSILLPENILLPMLAESHGFAIPFDREGIIGSNFVKGIGPRSPASKVARKFISDALTLQRNKRAEYDDEVYYIPYFKNYFCGLEDAYENVSSYLARSFEGYIVVVNNTHRGIVIPVSNTIEDIWQSLGFQTQIVDAKESFHVGSKNPRAKGFRARHTTYVVRIWR
jgi:hypothetical protein